MKNRMYLLLIALLSISFTGMSQTNKLTSSRSIKLEKQSIDQAIELDIAGNVDQLKIEVSCRITTGQITLEIIDPNGQPQGKYKAGSVGNLAMEESGRLEKYVEKPEKGIWKVKIIALEATASLYFETKQYQVNKKNESD